MITAQPSSTTASSDPTAKLLHPDFYHMSDNGPVPTAASTSTPTLQLRPPSSPSEPRRFSASTATGPDSPTLSKNQGKKRSEKTSDDIIAIASTKRNADFHTLFRSVPEDDRLMDDYGCALQKEILVQGRIYFTEHHVCFNANIFGWVTNLVIDYADITDIEKRTTAIFIPNAIQITTHQSKVSRVIDINIGLQYFFTSFLSRDQAFDMLKSLWKASLKHPSPSNDSAESTITKVDDEDEDEDEFTDDTLSTLSGSSYTLDGEASSPSALIGPLDKQEKLPDTRSRHYERQNTLDSLPTQHHPSLDRRRTASESHLATRKDAHVEQRSEATACACERNGGHYTHTVMDQIYTSSIEKIYGVLADREFLIKFLTETEKNTEVAVGSWQKGKAPGEAHSSRDISYIKPLNNAIGPRSTKCFLKEQTKHLDLEDYVTQVITTQTPDVPSGSSFCVKTRVCIMWAGKSRVRVLVTVLVEFTKSSWLKSTIEKACVDGQISYYKALDVAIRKTLQSFAELTTPPTSATDKQQHRRRRQKQQQQQEQPIGQESKPGLPSSSDLMRIQPNSKMETTAAFVLPHIQIPKPTANQLTILCMMLLVCINLFIAAKMEHVSRRLATKVHDPRYFEIITDRCLESSNASGSGCSSSNSHFQQQLAHLERMIQQAGKGIDQVSKAFEEQQKVILQQRDW
ncbi:hypothetical protein BX666DRAFT_2113219 [Dichotomocladium elegans]|nr:hypothetical protein BX666DRAFT_2113219 [Dichotomocladium elegans]